MKHIFTFAILLVFLFACNRGGYQICTLPTEEEYKVLTDSISKPSIEKSLDSLRVLSISYELIYNGERNRAKRRQLHYKIDRIKTISDSLERLK